MVTFAVDPNDPDMVVSSTGRKLPRAAVSPADIATAPAQPVAPATDAVAAVLAKRDAVMKPLEVASVTTNTQRGIAPSVLNPVLQSNTAATEQLATTIEQQGKDKTEREAARLAPQIESTTKDIASAQETEATKRQRAEIARLNGLAIAAQQDPEIDPDRFIDSMSTGRKIALVITAAVTGAIAGIRGEAGKPNPVVGMLMNRIDQDLMAQKEAIASGRIRRGNLIQWFKEQGMSEDQAADAAKATSLSLLQRKFELESEMAKTPEYQENARVMAEQLRAQTEQANNQLKLSLGTDRQTESVTKERPKPAGGMTVKDVVDAMKAGRDMQQLQRSGLTQEEYDKQAEKVVERGEKARDFKNAVEDLASAVGVTVTRDAHGNVLVTPKDGSAKTGFGLLGADSGFWASAKRNEVTRAFSRVQRADVMSMIREPSAALQNKFAASTERPFLDGDIIDQLKDLAEIAYRAENDSVSGFNDVVVQDYRSKTGAAAGGATDTLRPRGQ